MIRTSPRLLSAAVLLAALSGCGGDPEPADPNVVRPRFGWKAGMTARVTAERVDFETVPGPPDTVRVRREHVLRVERHPDGLRLTLSGVDPATSPLLRPVELRALDGVIVERDGALLRVEGLAERRRVVADSLRGQPPEVLRAAESAFSDRAVRMAADAYWTLLVERWAGRDIVIGEFHDEQDTIPSPVGGDPVRARVEWYAEGRVPCRDGERETRCVRFRIRTATDHTNLARSYRQVVEAPAGTPRDATDPDPILVHAGTTYLVTEEATLRPHRMEAEHFLSIMAANGDEQAKAVERTVTRFEYDG